MRVRRELEVEIVSFDTRVTVVREVFELLHDFDPTTLVGCDLDECEHEVALNRQPDSDYSNAGPKARALLNRASAWVDDESLTWIYLGYDCADLTFSVRASMTSRPREGGSPRSVSVCISWAGELEWLDRAYGERLLDFVSDVCTRISPSSGGSWISVVGHDSPGPPLRLARVDNRLRPESGASLTHYGWMMVLPGALLSALGGIDAVATHPLVVSSRRYRSSDGEGLVVLAAESALEMGGERLEAWRDFLEPVMPPLVQAMGLRPTDPAPLGLADRDLKLFPGNPPPMRD